MAVLMRLINPTIQHPTGLQRMMAYWEQMNAVNAVQIAELSESIDPVRLQKAIERLFEKFLAADSLNRWPTLSSGQGDCRGDVSVEFHSEQPGISKTLDSIVTELLNQSFSDYEPPFRVASVDLAERHYLLLTYRHSIADARSVALLMQSLLQEVYGGESGGLPLQVHRTNQPLYELFPSELHRAATLRSVGSSIKTLWALNRCHRRRPRDPNSFQMRFQVHSERLSLATLRRQAERWGATVGELLVAAMLDYFFCDDRRQGVPRWSPNRCVSVLADLTRRSSDDHSQLFGQYLSPLNVVAHYRRQGEFAELIRKVKATTRSSEVVVNSLCSLRGLSVNDFFVRCCTRPFANWYQEHLFPVSGALSNINLHKTVPPAQIPLPVKNYFRGTCATQFAPMILCLTTVNETCTLTTTHRETVYSAEEMQNLARHVVGLAFRAE